MFTVLRKTVLIAWHTAWNEITRPRAAQWSNWEPTTIVTHRLDRARAVMESAGLKVTVKTERHCHSDGSFHYDDQILIVIGKGRQARIRAYETGEQVDYGEIGTDYTLHLPAGHKDRPDFGIVSASFTNKDFRNLAKFLKGELGWDWI